MKHRTAWMGMALGTALALTLAATSRAADYSSAASGNYNTNATWNAVSNPGGNAGADTVAVNAHTVTVTAANDANLDTITINSGGTLRSTHGVEGTNYFAGALINLNGGTLRTDVRTWGGAQTGTNLVATANGSVIDTYDSRPYATPYTGTAIYHSLSIQPAVNKLTVTNSMGDVSPFELGRTAFATGFALNHPVEFAVEGERALLQFTGLAIAAAQVLTKSGSGTLQLTGAGASAAGSTLRVNGGTLEVMSGNNTGLGGVSIVEINSGSTLFSNYATAGRFLGATAVSLNGGRINYGYNQWAQDLGGYVTIAADSTINMYNYAATMNGDAPGFRTLAFAAAPSGTGYELHATHIGSHANWAATRILSEFRQTSTIANSGAINVDQYAGVRFTAGVTLGSGVVLTKRGLGALQFTSTISGTGSLAVEAGDVALGNNNVSVSRMLGGGGTISSTAGRTITLAPDTAVAPGSSTGTLTLAGPNLTMAPTTTSFFELGGPNQGASVNGYDFINAGTGTVALDGKIQVEGLPGFYPEYGDSLTILSAGTVNGTFASREAIGDVIAGYTVAYTSVPGSVILTEFDLFPLADIAVSSLGGGNYLIDGTGSTDPDNDPIANGIIAYEWTVNGDGAFAGAADPSFTRALAGGLHVFTLRVQDNESNWGSLLMLNYVVPEPGSLALLALATVALGLRRRRPRR